MLQEDCYALILYFRFVTLFAVQNLTDIDKSYFFASITSTDELQK